MNTILMKEYAFKDVDKFYFVKKVYFNFTDEKVYCDLLVYTQKYGADMDYLLDCVEASKFDEVVEKTIENYLNQKGVSYEKY